MTSFSDLKTEADLRWQDLVSGDKPWIRVGTAMCGQAAGAVEVVETLRSELESRSIEAIVDEVGCLGLCLRRAPRRYHEARRSEGLFHRRGPQRS